MVRAAVQRVVTSLLLVATGWVAPASSAQAQTAVTRTVVLHPIRGAYLRIDFNYNFAQALPPFAHEPVLAGKQTARGLIPTVPPTPLLRNITDNELYLKVDHSQDYSVGSSVAYRSRYIGHVLFEDLQVSTARDGTPLHNTVEVSRDRNLLRLSYQLTGAGGERYSYYNWAHPPSFTIYKGPLRIASGTFPFG